MSTLRHNLSALLLVGAVLPPAAHAYTINSGATDVGGLDIFKGAQYKSGNSNPAAEEAFIESLAGGLDYIWKTGSLTATATDQSSDVLAAYISPGDDYYVLKNSTYMAAFQNVAFIDWVVFDTTISLTLQEKVNGELVETTQPFSYFFNLSDTQLAISHISLFDSSSNPPSDNPGGDPTVPAPAPLALMVPMMAGLMWRRKRN